MAEEINRLRQELREAEFQHYFAAKDKVENADKRAAKRAKEDEEDAERYAAHWEKQRQQWGYKSGGGRKRKTRKTRKTRKSRKSRAKRRTRRR